MKDLKLEEKKFSKIEKFENLLKDIYIYMVEKFGGNIHQTYDPDRSGYWSHTEGYIEKEKPIFFRDIEYAEFNYSNKNLNNFLKDYVKRVIDDFEEECKNEEDFDENYHELLDNYTSDIIFYVGLDVQLREIGWCTDSEYYEKYHKDYKYLIYVQGFLSDEYGRALYDLKKYYVIPVFENDLELTFLKTKKRIDSMYEEYEKLGEETIYS